MSPARKWTLRFVGVGTFLVLWEIAGRILGEALFAPLSSVIVTYPELVREYDLFRELATSLRQLAIGYVLGCVVGITVGTAMGRSRLADGLLQPWVSMLFATSIAALVPLFILLFGFGLAFRVAIVFMSTVWYVLLNTYHGARGVDHQLLETSRAFEATPLQTFRMVLLPALYPYILAVSVRVPGDGVRPGSGEGHPLDCTLTPIRSRFGRILPIEGALPIFSEGA